MRLGVIMVVTVALAACGGRDDARDSRANQADLPVTSAIQNSAVTPTKGGPSVDRWALRSGGEGVTLTLAGATTGTAMQLYCQSGRKTLLVNVPAFRPVLSEERMSFGSGGEAEALVADTAGDARRGGVSASGAVPAQLAAMLGGLVSASYGDQESGPHPAPPPGISRSFVAACNADPGGRREGARESAASPCMTQGAEQLGVRPLRAVGTEPFWAARIEGRCVTYSHPEDQDGTRVWTRYEASAGGGRWSGSLGGQRFELRTRAAPGCSDGMSETLYPIAVELIVHGERRTGCAHLVMEP